MQYLPSEDHRGIFTAKSGIVEPVSSADGVVAVLVTDEHSLITIERQRANFGDLYTKNQPLHIRADIGFDCLYISLQRLYFTFCNIFGFTIAIRIISARTSNKLCHLTLTVLRHYRTK